MSSRWSLIAALVLLAFASGCAHVIEFNLPKEFKDGKQIEDPPGTALPIHADVMPC